MTSRRSTRALPAALAFLFGLTPLMPPVHADAATITIVNNDGAGEGFNDPTAVSPVGGNPGTTLGAQRLNAFTFAANIWAGQLTSTVTIFVDATMDPLTCSAMSATLGQAGPTNVFRDFSGALVAGTWYPQALANKLHGSDLDAGTHDITAQFNSAIGTTCAFPNVWYYGFDASPPGSDIDFVSVVLHELGHGLGFLTFVDVSTGAKLGGFDDTFMRDLLDKSVGLHWPPMTDGQRQTSAIDTGDLFWTGAQVVANSGFLTSGRDVSGNVLMFAPNPLQPGSSVSHFDTSCSPDQLLEPIYTGPNHNPQLARDVMTDIGWGSTPTTTTTTTSTTTTTTHTTTTSTTTTHTTTTTTSTSTTTTHTTTTSTTQTTTTTHTTTTTTSTSTTTTHTTTTSTTQTTTTTHTTTTTSTTTTHTTTTSTTQTTTTTHTTTTSTTLPTTTSTTTTTPTTTTTTTIGPTTTSTTSTTSTTLAVAAVGHLKCYKAKDARPKAGYTLDLIAGVAGFPDENGCTLKLGATSICVEVTKQNVSPSPPGGGPAIPPNAGSVFLSYKIKCPKHAVAPIALGDQFGVGPFTVGTAAELLVPALPGPANDHFKCYKAKDARAKAAYTMDLIAGVGGFTNELGCSLKLGASRICVQVTKQNVAPPPPGGGPGPGPGSGERFVGYKLKCPKGAVPAGGFADQFGAGTFTPGAPKTLIVPAQ